MSTSQCFRDGITRVEDLQRLGLIPPRERLLSPRPVAVFECIQQIPCNSCVYACRPGAVIMETVNDIPRLNFDRCTGCMACLLVCPGLAISVVQEKDGKASITIPYEMPNLPRKDEEVLGLNSQGKPIATAKVERVVSSKRNYGTALVTISVPSNLIMEVRAIKPPSR